MRERLEGVVVAAVVAVAVVVWGGKQEGAEDGARFLKGGEW